MRNRTTTFSSLRLGASCKIEDTHFENWHETNNRLENNFGLIGTVCN